MKSLRLIALVALVLATAVPTSARADGGGGGTLPSRVKPKQDPQYTAGVRAIEAKKYADAIPLLQAVVDRDQLERGFRHLSIDHRAVVVLHHYLDLPLDRVAEILGIPVGTAHSRLHHAMRALRAALDADARAPVQEVAR